MNTDTEQVIYEMLTENTGRHLLDSGGFYGRNFERNAKKSIEDFRREPEVHWEADVDQEGEIDPTTIDRTVSVFHFLKDLEIDDLCAQFNELNTGADNWDADCEVYGVSREAWAMLEDENYGLSVGRVFNTYNGDSDLSQVLQGAWIEVNDESYLILQIHGGCDVRGGYTDARMFKPFEAGLIHEYLQEFIYDEDMRIEECKLYFENK